MIPDDRQEKAIKKMVSEPTRSALNASLMGVGKTLMAVETAIRLNVKTILVIAPLGTFYGWLDTIAEQTNGKSVMVRIDSSKDGKQAMINLAKGIDGFYFIGREYFKTKDWSKIIPDMAIIDECHAFQNRNSKGFKVLMKLKAGYKLSLSGTPFGNKFEGAWAISRWLWADKIPRSYWKWVEQWCETAYSPFSQIEILGERKSGEYVKTLPCYIRLMPPENIELVHETRFVDLVPAQRKIYDKFQRDLVVWLEGNPMIAEVPIAARIRLRQMTLAVPSIDSDDKVYFEDDSVSTKYKALKEIIDDNADDKIFILTDSQKYARIVTNRLNHSHTEPIAFEWSGQANQIDRHNAKQKFRDPKSKLKYIVAVIPAIAEGVDGLQDVCSTVVWLSHSDNNLLNQQVLDRIRRRGQKEVVKVYDILARDTYDQGQLSALVQRQLDMNNSLRKGGSK